MLCPKYYFVLEHWLIKLVTKKLEYCTAFVTALKLSLLKQRGIGDSMISVQ